MALVACSVWAGCGGEADRSAGTDRAIEVFGPYRGIEADRFMETVQPFVDATGIDVRYVGSLDFVDDLRQRVGEGSDPPDVAIVPQPGLVSQLAEEGRIVSTDAAVERAVEANYPAATAALGHAGGRRFAVPFRITIKSLVWYRPAVFEAHGWEVPRTLDELDALVARIQRESDLAPWCFGIASGTATGWPATDWVEDLVLRTAGPDVYQRWAKGEIGFADRRIEAAFERFRSLVLDPGHVDGGVAGVVETPVSQAMAPLFAEPPGCAMSKQPDFATGWMPDGTRIGPDGDVAWFALPGASRSGTPPILIGGDNAVQFRHGPRVDALMAYLAGPTAGRSWVHRGGFLSPKSSIPEDEYNDDYRRSLAALVDATPDLRFDASDQMPPDVGADLLWKTISEWVAGAVDYDTLARRIDRALQ